MNEKVHSTGGWRSSRRPRTAPATSPNRWRTRTCPDSLLVEAAAFLVVGEVVVACVEVLDTRLDRDFVDLERLGAGVSAAAVAASRSPSSSLARARLLPTNAASRSLLIAGDSSTAPLPLGSAVPSSVTADQERYKATRRHPRVESSRAQRPQWRRARAHHSRYSRHAMHRASTIPSLPRLATTPPNVPLRPSTMGSLRYRRPSQASPIETSAHTSASYRYPTPRPSTTAATARPSRSSTHALPRASPSCWHRPNTSQLTQRERTREPPTKHRATKQQQSIWRCSSGQTYGPQSPQSAGHAHYYPPCGVRVFVFLLPRSLSVALFLLCACRSCTPPAMARSNNLLCHSMGHHHLDLSINNPSPTSASTSSTTSSTSSSDIHHAFGAFDHEPHHSKGRRLRAVECLCGSARL